MNQTNFATFFGSNFLTLLLGWKWCGWVFRPSRGETALPKVFLSSTNKYLNNHAVRQPMGALTSVFQWLLVSFLFFAFLSSCTFNWADDSEVVQPVISTEQAWQEFNEQNGNNWQVRWDENTGLPRKVFGYHTYPKSLSIQLVQQLKRPKYSIDESTADTIFTSFVNENKPLFHIDVDALRTVELRKVGSRSIIEYQQYYKNIPVLGALVSATLTHAGEVIALNSAYQSGIGISSIPTITSEQAKQIALSNVEPKELRVALATTYGPELFVLPLGLNGSTEYALVWALQLQSLHPLFGQALYIDAHKGTILKRENMLIQ